MLQLIVYYKGNISRVTRKCFGTKDDISCGLCRKRDVSILVLFQNTKEKYLFHGKLVHLLYIKQSNIGTTICGGYIILYAFITNISQKSCCDANSIQMKQTSLNENRIDMLTPKTIVLTSSFNFNFYLILFKLCLLLKTKTYHQCLVFLILFFQYTSLFYKFVLQFLTEKTVTQFKSRILHT